MCTEKTKSKCNTMVIKWLPECWMLVLFFFCIFQALNTLDDQR